MFLAESADLRDTLKMVITQSKRVLLNLSGSIHRFSVASGMLVGLYHYEGRDAIKLANLTQRVGDLLQVTKLLTVFEVYDSEKKPWIRSAKAPQPDFRVWRGRLPALPRRGHFP